MLIPWCSRVETERLLLPSGDIASVTKCVTSFTSMSGKPLPDTYGGKAVLDWEGEPVFAELAILRALQHEGWEGVWVDTFGHRTFRVGMRDVPGITLPKPQQAIYDSIASRSPMPGGCWDVFAWKHDGLLFAEGKRSKRDALRPNQLHWLEAALEVGYSAEVFLLVEWNLA